MRPISEIKANYRLRIVSSGEDGFAAYINHPCYKPTAIAVIASWGGGWEHVSVSLARRCPTWEEMCMVKDIFWGEEECVVQFHPPRSEYVNRHPYCLHLWKKIGEEYETPPKEYVGLKETKTMKKKRGIFAGRQQTPPAIPPTQISDAKLLADLDVEIAAAERAANPPEGSTAVINALSPGLAAMMPTATKQARKKLLTLQQVRKRLAELIEKEYQHE